MAEKAEKKPEAPAPSAAGEKKAGGGLLSKTPVLIGGAMIIEAIVLFGGFKFLGGGGPKTRQLPSWPGRQTKRTGKGWRGGRKRRQTPR